MFLSKQHKGSFHWRDGADDTMPIIVDQQMFVYFFYSLHTEISFKPGVLYGFSPAQQAKEVIQEGLKGFRHEA